MLVKRINVFGGVFGGVPVKDEALVGEFADAAFFFRAANVAFLGRKCEGAEEERKRGEKKEKGWKMNRKRRKKDRK